MSKRLTIIAAAVITTGAVVSVIYAVAPATQPAIANPLLPPMTAPISSMKATVVPVPYQPILPPAVVSRSPRMLPLDSLHPLRAVPALDVPPLAETGGALPANVKLPAGPTIRLHSEDVSQPPVGTIAAKPDAGRSTLRTDPSAGMVQSGALLVTPPPRTTSAAAQLLTIPDPAHQPGLIPTFAPATEELPVFVIDRPAPTTLPSPTK